MRIWTYSEAREKIQEEMDLQEENFVSETEFIDYINEGIDEAESEIHRLYQDYFLTSETLALVANTASYDLPEDIYANKIRHIQYRQSNTNAYEIKRIKLSDIKFVQSSSTAFFQYNIENAAGDVPQLVLYPTPTASDSSSVKIWYIRNAGAVTGDDDDPIDIPEFIEFIFAYVRHKIARKELSPLAEDYANELERLRAMMRETLDDMIPNEDTNIAIDASFYDDFDDFYRT